MQRLRQVARFHRFLPLLGVLWAGVVCQPPNAFAPIRVFQNDWQDQGSNLELDPSVGSVSSARGNELDTQPNYHSRLRLDSNSTYAVAGFGRGNSWQDFAASLGLRVTPHLWLQFSPGIGLHRSEGVGAPDIRFFQDLQSISLHSGVRYYFWKVFPVFIQGGLGGVRWSGDVDPSRTIDESRPSPVALTESDFSGVGLYTDFEVGFSYAFKKGFFIDYRLAGLSKSFVLSSDLQSGQSELQENLEDSLEDFFSYGLINIRLGYIW